MKKTYKCDNCDRKFKTEEGCEIHEEHCDENEGGDWECVYCGRDFSTQSKAEKHERHCREGPGKDSNSHQTHQAQQTTVVHNKDKGFLGSLFEGTGAGIGCCIGALVIAGIIIAIISSS